MLVGLVVLNVLVWSQALASGESKLRVYFFDIGQGDSIFIDSPTHGQVLIDGGPSGSKVLGELGKAMPFGDHSIDVVIATHPDADHISGLVDVIKNYKVGTFMEPGVSSDSKVYQALESTVAEEKVPKVLARRGMTIDLGSGVKLVILFPNQDVTNWETNDASIVAKLVYGNESFLLTGDSTKKAEYILLGLDKNVLKSTVLKAGHHGSKTSSSRAYVAAVAPEYSIISAGKNNRYGHPAPETIETLKNAGSKILSTIDLGTIEFETDGTSLILK